MQPARLVSAALAFALLLHVSHARAQTFTIEQVLSAPFASDIVAAPDGRRFAWVSYDQGRRNVWLASAQEGAAKLAARPVTHYTADDGLDVGDLAFVPRHTQVLYVRGEDFENPDKPSPNPAQVAHGVAQEVYLVSPGTAPVKLGEGHSPIGSPDGSRILFLHENQVLAVANRRGAKPEVLFKVRGTVDSLRFSPGGGEIAFVCTRVDHSFIGVYSFADQSLRWLDASLGYDLEPRWSPDGSRIAFLRLPSTHDEVGLVAHRTGSPWSIRVANLKTHAVGEAYRAPSGAGSVFHPLSSDVQIFWSGEHLIFPAENDGWLHLYTVPVAGGAARLLTPGQFEIEYAAASADGSTLVYASNSEDIDRRHLWLLRPADGALSPLTRGTGIETQPVVLADGQSVAFLRSDARTPGHAALLAPGDPEPTDFLAEGLPPGFPAAALVNPTSVQLPETAGIAAHATLFLPPAAKPAERHPALVFMHGGPIRQMLVGWHYMHYYSNAYAFNQYLAAQGYVVLALNYRAGIGYGLDFREAPGIGADGASEYNDLLAAAAFLRGRADVDPARLGLWGGSYGGYMTALGLARNSDLFVAGVDFHGVHDWYHWTLGERGNAPMYVLDTPAAVLDAAFASSPMSSVAKWRSPVLLVHGDDDRNVVFSESVRLAEALRKQGVEYSELVFPDEVHDFLRHASWIRAYTATAEFLDAKVAKTAR
jgi:dipeptidyl aminopeptidase/acylaminoacyl peptidase